VQAAVDRDRGERERAGARLAQVAPAEHLPRRAGARRGAGRVGRGYAPRAGCEPGKACDEHPDCKPGASCRCDDQGRLARIDRDTTGDGIVDRVRFAYDADGRVASVDTDWSRDDRVDRHQEYVYDGEGRRLSTSGWQTSCGGAGSTLRFRCVYEAPCPPPYDRCAACRAELETQKPDGAIVPCGKTATGAGVDRGDPKQ
jgi:hypothetical protein